jgi:hypothetical protein
MLFAPSPPKEGREIELWIGGRCALSLARIEKFLDCNDQIGEKMACNVGFRIVCANTVHCDPRPAIDDIYYDHDLPASLALALATAGLPGERHRSGE